MSVLSVRRWLAGALVCSAAAASAQNGNSNKEADPYSRYGIGEQLSGTNIVLRGMGYTSTAYQNATLVNTDNPASYSSLRLTTYEGGFTGSARTIYTDGKSYSTGSATLAYLRVGIPLGRKAGMAFGLQPQSHIYYHSMDTASQLVNENGGQMFYNKTARDFSGEGGLNYAFLGGAYNIGPVSLGLNAGYMFGNIRSTSRVVNIDTTSVLGSDISRFTKYGGIYWKAGVQYHDTNFANGLHLRLGATASISQSLNGSRDNYMSSFFYVGTVEYQDTAYRISGGDGKLVLPATYSIGALLNGTNWAVGADVSRSDWSVYKAYDVPDSVRPSTLRFSAGGEYVPDPQSTYHYFSRVSYRLGFYYGQDYVKLRNTDLNYYGITAGASFPFKRSQDRSMGVIHTAIEFGRRGTESNGLVQMNYLRLHLGISLSDRWFIKRKYD